METISQMMSEVAKKQAQKIDSEFQKLLDRNHLTIQDFIDKKYKSIIQEGPYWENPRWTKYSIRRTRGRNAKKDIDSLRIYISYLSYL